MHGDQTPQYFQAIPHLEKKYRNGLAAPWTSGLSLVERFETVFAQNEEMRMCRLPETPIQGLHSQETRG